MKLAVLLIHDDQTTLNTLIPLVMTAAYADDEIIICALGAGINAFLAQNAEHLEYNDLDLKEVIGKYTNVRVCRCINGNQCSFEANDFIPGIEVTDILGIVQAIRDTEKVMAL
jgi:intracellular sulfur oxidation DsrE/DsrF family protein